MAYYRKKEVKDIITKVNDDLKKKNINSLTPIEESFMQLANEEDVVVFSWLLVEEKSEVKFKTKSFARITSNLYTNDRYVLDSYAATKKGELITEFIEEKLKAKENDKKKKEISEELKRRIKEKK